MATVVQCSTNRETRVGHSQKAYSDTCRRYLVRVTEQLIGVIVVYIKLWVGGDFSTYPTRVVTRAMMVPCMQKGDLDLNGTWFRQYITKKLGIVHAY